MSDLLEILKCPISGDNLIFNGNHVFSEKNNNKYKIEDGIYRFLNNLSDDQTSEVREFYMDDPFPNYNTFDNLEKFVQKIENNYFINSISSLLKPNDFVLEFGCGTGQLGNFLAATNHSKIISADLTYNSLKLANNFKIRNNIKGIDFFECDIFKPCFKENSFDLIICSGVLHHTINPYQGFLNLLKMLKNDGLIIIGLYNSISRIKNSAIKYLSKLIGKSAFYLFDEIYRKKDTAAQKSWIKDQYYHPLEKRYFFSELHGWYEKNNIEFINSIPSYNKKIDFVTKTNKGDAIDQLNVQLIDLFENKEGGLFLFLGKKIKK